MANDDSAQASGSLRALCRQAGEQAASATKRPTEPSSSATGLFPNRKPRLTFVLPSSLGLLAAAVVAAQFNSSATDAVVQASPAALAASHTAASPPHASIAAAVSEPLRWQGSDLLVDIDAVPLPQAIADLARITHSSVAGIELLRSAPPVTLHGRFTTVAAAWQHLLAGRAGFSSSCSPSACRVWITGAPAASNEVSTPAAAKAAPGAAQPAAPKSEEEESQPGGSC